MNNIKIPARTTIFESNDSNGSESSSESPLSSNSIKNLKQMKKTNEQFINNFKDTLVNFEVIINDLHDKIETNDGDDDLNISCTFSFMYHIKNLHKKVIIFFKKI